MKNVSTFFDKFRGVLFGKPREGLDNLLGEFVSKACAGSFVDYVAKKQRLADRRGTNICQDVSVSSVKALRQELLNSPGGPCFKSYVPLLKPNEYKWD